MEKSMRRKLLRNITNSDLSFAYFFEQSKSVDTVNLIDANEIFSLICLAKLTAW